MARRDKPCAAGPGWPPGQGAQRGIGAPQGAPEGWPSAARSARRAGATQHPPAPPAANAFHLNVHDTL
ncbi:hypothetical protein XMIN_4109 [Xanthomonas citri pv. mangiferaeindicae LMG 941]|nr:hypothetical protein XMIN_4109 [Xanthomonas citri pv. mangiferaeindicae LMG 941]